MEAPLEKVDASIILYPNVLYLIFVLLSM